MMWLSTFLISLVALAPVGLVMANDFVGPNWIKVFLYGGAAFYSEVAVDVFNNTCLSLDNNLIDARVRSALIGGRDIPSVLSRKDHWYCVFYDNYSCEGTDDTTLAFPAGVNNLASIGWGRKIRGIRCINEAG